MSVGPTDTGHPREHELTLTGKAPTGGVRLPPLWSGPRDAARPRTGEERHRHLLAAAAHVRAVVTGAAA